MRLASWLLLCMCRGMSCTAVLLAAWLWGHQAVLLLLLTLTSPLLPIALQNLLEALLNSGQAGLLAGGGGPFVSSAQSTSIGC